MVRCPGVSKQGGDVSKPETAMGRNSVTIVGQAKDFKEGTKKFGLQ